MKKIKNWISITFLTMLVHVGYSQNNDYIATDSSLTAGIKLVAGTSIDNAQFIRVKNNREVIKYSPDQIQEYGFKNGTKYFSKEIVLDGEGRQAFLEVLERGSLTLYYYADEERKTFFIENDSLGLVELKKDKLSVKLLTKDCKHISNALKLATYSKKSLKKLVSYYNECKRQAFPYSKVGIASGIRRTNLTQSSNLNNAALDEILFSPSSTIYIGVYVDLPIEMSHFSFNSGVFFTKTGFSENSVDPTSDTDVVINLTSLNIPILLRYTIPTTRLRPFLELGGQMTYNLQNSSSIYNATIDDGIITINSPNQRQLVSDYLFGYMIGCGLQYNINYRKTLSFEIRHGTSFGENRSLKINGLDIMVGFTF